MNKSERSGTDSLLLHYYKGELTQFYNTYNAIWQEYSSITSNFKELRLWSCQCSMTTLIKGISSVFVRCVKNTQKPYLLHHKSLKSLCLLSVYVHILTIDRQKKHMRPWENTERVMCLGSGSLAGLDWLFAYAGRWCYIKSDLIKITLRDDKAA